MSPARCHLAVQLHRTDSGGRMEMGRQMANNAPDRRELFRRKRADPIDNSATLPPSPNEIAADIKNTIDRIANVSVSELDRLIAELTNIRDLLRAETERVQREVSGYVSAAQTSVTSTKVIADSLVHWKSKI